MKRLVDGDGAAVGHRECEAPGGAGAPLERTSNGLHRPCSLDLPCGI